MPGRQAAEHLTVLHREVLRDPVRAAHRVGADAECGGLLDALHVGLPLVGLAHRLRQAVVDDGAPGGLGKPPDHAVLQLDILAAAGLDRAGAQLAQDVAEREDFGFVGPQGRDVDALRVVMALLARHRETERASLHAAADDLLHLLDLRVGGARFLAVLAHHVMAHRGVADQVADIDAEPLVETVHVLRDRLPVEIDGAEHLHRDRFDIGEELGEPLLGALPHRRQRQRAVAEDDRGGAMLGREGAQRVPGDLRVVMAVVVDKPGGDGAARGVDRLRRRTAQLPDFDDFAVLDADIAAKRRHARTVDNEPVFDQQIIGHCFFLPAGSGPRPRPENPEQSVRRCSANTTPARRFAAR